MLYNYDFDYKLYNQLSELNEKLAKSETDRNILEAKFQYLHEVYKNKEEEKLAFLKAKYNQFLEDSKERSERNEKILKSLQKVEIGANAVFAKTERLKQLRSHYDAYLSRAKPLWRHPDALGEVGVSTTWVREPRLGSAFPHPAMLLPGGGAVMLPVHPQSAYPPRQVEHTDTQTFPNASSKVIGTLGKAGEIMMQELGMLKENNLHSVQQPLSFSHFPHTVNTPFLYQPYPLPIYLPPAPTYSVNPPLNTSLEHSTIPFSSKYGDHYTKTAENSPPQDKRGEKLYMEHSPKSSERSYREDNKAKERQHTFLKNMPYTDSNPKKRNSSIRTAVPKDNYEIECLTADNNSYGDDLNLSDDDVIDNVATILPASDYHSVRNKAENNQTSYKFKLAAEAVQSNIKAGKSIDYYRLENVPSKTNTFAKTVEVAHQKSIDELKAILSVEHDESFPEMYSQEQGENGSLMLGDEEVPDDFNEQNFPESHYDQRYQNDVSRNVILEEDEDEDDPWPNGKYPTQNISEHHFGQNGNVRGQTIDNNEPDNSQYIKKYQNSQPSFDQRSPQKNNMQPREDSKSVRSRPPSGGRRSPSPTLAKGNSENCTPTKVLDSQRFPENGNQFLQRNSENVSYNYNQNMNNNGNRNESRTPEQLSNQEYNETQSQHMGTGNYETQAHDDRGNQYYSPDQPDPAYLPDHFEHQQYEPEPIPAEVQGYSDDYYQITEQPQDPHGLIQNNQLNASDDHQYRYESSDFVSPNEMENLSRDPNIDYSDHQQYQEQQERTYQGYTNGHNDVQHANDDNQYYVPNEEHNRDPYYTQPYTSENNNEHYDQNTNDSPQYFTHPEQYQEVPPDPAMYGNIPVEQTLGDNGSSVALMNDQLGYHQQVDRETPNAQSGQSDDIVQNDSHTNKVEEIVAPNPVSPVKVDLVEPLQQVEEKPRPSPQKRLQRRASVLSQQSPQRQKQGQKGTPQKSQQRQSLTSPKKSERTQQSSPKKPLTPEPQPPASIMTQLIDSESESYQVEPSGQNPDDSDFDFSIGK